jgi:lipid A oxidase
MAGTLRLKVLSLAAGALVGVSGPALCEFQGSVYLGWNGSFDSDVTFTGNGMNTTFQDVPWQGLSFFNDGGAPYYGARAGYWFDPHWGVFLDYTHAKVRADPGAMVSFSGTSSGTAMIGDVFERFEFTDGINILTVNALYRTDPMGRFQPYFGVGAGFTRPHVEVTSTTLGLPETFQYEFGGMAAEALAGIDFRINDWLSIFTEYKLSYSHIDAPLTGGYNVETSIFTNQIAAGLSFRFGH